MKKNWSVEHLTPPAGTSIPPYPAARDFWYRTALWILAAAMLGVGSAILLRSTPLADISAAVGILANALASWMFLVWMPKWRWMVRGLALLAVVGFGVSLPFFAWGGLLASSAIMAAKEYHCFKFWPARWIPWISLATGLVWLSGISALAGLLAILFAGLSGFWLALLLQRSKLPLFTVDAQ